MLCYQSWHEMNQDLTPVMLPILTWEKTWVESSIKKSSDCYNLIRMVSLGDRAAIAKFHGVQNKDTSIIVAEDFVFDKYVILHEMGHVFGCAHEKDPDHDSPIEFNPGK